MTIQYGEQTMVFVDRKMACEHSVHRFTVEHSDLGLGVGNWPQHLQTNLGNGQDLYAYHDEINDDGDRLWVDYLQGNGCVHVRVFND